MTEATAQLDLHVLAMLGDRDTYRRHSKFVQSLTVEPLAADLVQSIGRYYTQFPAVTAIDWQSFYTWLTTVDMPWRKAPHKQVWGTMCRSLARLDTPADLRTRVLEALTERHYAAELRDIAEDVVEGRGRHSLEEAAEVLRKWRSRSAGAAAEASHFVSGSLADDLTQVRTDPGLEWRLEELNVAKGPLRIGELVLLAARPEMAKTSFVASQAVYMAHQLPADRPVIWFGNEEGGNRIRRRLATAALGVPERQLLADPDAAAEAYHRRVGGADKIKVYANRHLTIEEIVEVCEEHNPGLIICDQLRKVEGFEKAASSTERFQKLFMEARDIAERIAPVIVVHQADATAEGQMRLRPSQLEACKTEIQGEIDLLLMMGGTDAAAPTRMLTICKNKSPGGQRFDATYQHASFPLQFNKELAAFTGEMRRP